MKRYVLQSVLFFSFSLFYAQNSSPWKRISKENVGSEDRSDTRQNENDLLLFQLNEPVFKENLTSLHESNQIHKVEIEVPNKNGIFEKFSINENSNFEPELQSKYPEIRSYSGVGISDKTATIYFSVSPSGIQSMVLRSDRQTEFIEKTNSNKPIYKVFDSKSNKKGTSPLQCLTKAIPEASALFNKSKEVTSNNASFRTLRLALACTSEYTTYFGGKTKALEAMNATLTRINGIFNRDLSLNLVLISNTTDLIFNDAENDPFSAAETGANGAWNLELQNLLTSKIGNINYDIGHLFGASGGGGNAGCIGCICKNPISPTDLAKGSAYTSPSDGKPEGSSFDIDFVAHEMGHQLGANHTFSYENEGTGMSVEPGGGSTIMAYAGVTDFNVQNHSDDYFSYVSIVQIQNNLTSKDIANSIALSNQTPLVDAGLDYTIPKGTPFVLKGTASDPNGDSLTYCWEQKDPTYYSVGAKSIAYSTKTDGPIFRSFKPTIYSTRYLPSMNKVLSNMLSSTWESVSDVSRNLHFTLTVRDNAAKGLAQTNTDEMIVTVDATKGPFEITSQDIEDLSWAPLSLQTINWSVKNTDKLPGAALVNIKLSVDGGASFPIFLKAETPNDGSETIIVPNDIKGKNCRILIEPVKNIFFAVNKKPFAIAYSSTTTCSTFEFTGKYIIPESNNYTSKSITVPYIDETVSKVSININLTHEYLSDLQIDVANPQGQIVKLFEKQCGNSRGNLQVNFDDNGGALNCGSRILQTVAPYEPLGVFNELNPSGSWAFRIKDDSVGDSGFIDSASITICSKRHLLMATNPINLSSILLYPNPSKGDFSVLFSSKFLSGVTILIHDLTGKKIYEQNFQSVPLFNEIISLNNVQSGNYFVTIKDSYTTTVKKLIIN